MYLTSARRPTGRSLGRLNSILDEAFDGALTSSWLPVCDVIEDKDAVKLVAEVPGMTPEDVKISLVNNLLTIRGEKRQPGQEQNERMYRSERSYGAFERTLALPNSVDPDKITATYEHGLLTVRIPKAERARPREIPVQAA